MNQVIKSVELTNEQLEKINRFTRRKFSPEELFSFSVILCDNEVDRDQEAFSISALEKLAELFVGKTGIFDHSPTGSNQSARIYDTQVVRDAHKLTAYGSPYTCLKAQAYMVRSEKYLPLILDIDAGIKKEVSVGCSVSKKSCSVCGADSTHDRCEHIPGQRYQNKLCFTLLDQPTDAYEWSFVAIPAQPKAGVVKSHGGQTGQRKPEQLVKAFGKGDTTLTNAEQQSLKAYIQRLEQRAEMGESYLQELRKQVIGLSYLAGSTLDGPTTEAVVKKMNVSELKAYQKALNQQLDQTATGQLTPKPEQTPPQHNDPFKI